MDVPPLPEGRFRSIALVWLDSADNSPNPSGFYNGWKTKVETNNPNWKNYQYWIQLDVMKDDTWPTATCKTVNDCAKVIKNEADLVKSQMGRVDGLYFDNEGVPDLTTIVHAMDIVAKQYSPKLKLGFTKGISNCSSTVIEGVTFDYCMGQTYTNETADFYLNTPCGSVDMEKALITGGNRSWAHSGTITTDGYSVPMFCGGGNCQGDMDAAGTMHSCLDERLSDIGAKTVIDFMTKPEIAKKFPNVAFWFGNSAKGSGCPGRCGK